MFRTGKSQGWASPGRGSSRVQEEEGAPWELHNIQPGPGLWGGPSRPGCDMITLQSWRSCVSSTERPSLSPGQHLTE